MATVYAEIDLIVSFQEDIKSLEKWLKQEATSKTDLIEETKKTLEIQLDNAIQTEQLAEIEMNNAQEMLYREEMRVNSYNRSLTDEQEPITVQSYFYDNVDSANCNYSYSVNHRRQCEEAIEAYREYTDRYYKNQEFLLNDFAKNLNDSKRFIELYTSILNGAKECISLNMNNTSTSSSDKPYSKGRPSFRKGVVETVWKNAKDENGIVHDINTGEIIDWSPGEERKGVWDMGHIPKEKYSRMHEIYMDGNISVNEFLDWYNNPDNYVPELVSNNRSHRYEYF